MPHYNQVEPKTIQYDFNNTSYALEKKEPLVKEKSCIVNRECSLEKRKSLRAKKKSLMANSFDMRE